MLSWRDNAAPSTQEDLDGLLGPALGFAQEQLDKYGEFYPFAIVVDADGQQRMVAADAGAERPASADLIRTVVSDLTAQRAQLRAVAIVADVRLSDLGSDAIRVTLEHADGVVLSVVLPYRPRRFGRGVDYGELRATEAAAFIWSG